MISPNATALPTNEGHRRYRLLVAFLNRRDRFHQWALEIAQQVEVPLITCEPVLAEAAYHIQSSSHVLPLLDSGMIQLRCDLSAALSRLRLLATRYADRNPDLADLCLICLSEDFPHHEIVTVDSDFLVYRRWEREIIPTCRPI
jgi:predicted nucleic acid-binding protein